MPQQFLRYPAIVIGSLFMGFSLEVCYIPHRFLDGGMTGVAVLLGRWAGLPPAQLLFALNVAALWFGVRMLGGRFLRRTGVALFTLGTFLVLVGPLPPLLPPLPAALLGGAWLGVGLVMVLRAGGALDGAEILGLIVQATGGLSICWFLLLWNAAVFGAVALRYGLVTAAHSILAQVVVQAVLFVGLRATKRP